MEIEPLTPLYGFGRPRILVTTYAIYIDEGQSKNPFVMLWTMSLDLRSASNVSSLDNMPSHYLQYFVRSILHVLLVSSVVDSDDFNL